MKLDLIIPVYNAENKLSRCIETLLPFLAGQSQLDCQIVIADNGSQDRTLEIGRVLQRKFDRIRVVHLDLKGRGRALKQAWRDSQADILSYMDVDLSTDLEGFPVMIRALSTGDFHLATGSRLLGKSQTTRSWRRECLSRGYILLLKLIFHLHFSDAQCGFKAITRVAADRLLSLVEDDRWFFDTELLVLAERLGYRIFDLPVRWLEKPDSRMRVWRTVLEDLKGVIRLRRQLAEGKGSQGALRSGFELAACSAK
jgi:glycosyltransferase involved in cell wall biosynthesis